MWCTQGIVHYFSFIEALIPFFSRDILFTHTSHGVFGVDGWWPSSSEVTTNGKCKTLFKQKQRTAKRRPSTNCNYILLWLCGDKMLPDFHVYNKCEFHHLIHDKQRYHVLGGETSNEKYPRVIPHIISRYQIIVTRLFHILLTAAGHLTVKKC